jgi:hypothetical protein
MARCFVALCATLLLGCSRSPPEPREEKKSEPAATATSDAPAAPPAQARPFRFPAPERLVAIGDVHGDLTATRAALRLAGAIDAEDDWIGAKLVVVQVGDQLDRGDDERAILDLFSKLRREATKHGGAFIPLNGNHETMTVAGDFRYATPGGNAGFADVAPSGRASLVQGAPPELRGRAAAFSPGGLYARELAENPVVVIVGDSVFVHGGLLAEHVRYGIGRLNDEVSRWMLGQREMPPIVSSDAAPVWTRVYGADVVEPAACATLAKLLDDLEVRRLVVGHTVQERGVNSACDGMVWRIDVGLAAYYGKPLQVLEITKAGVRALPAAPAPSRQKRDEHRPAAAAP